MKNLTDMVEETLKDGIIVYHRKHETEHQYMVVSANMRFKDSQGWWIDGVLYQPLYDNKYEYFCRERNSFIEEFELSE